MKNLKLTGKIFYGLGIAGLGIIHFIYLGFRPVILPIPPEATQHISILVFLTGALLVIAGLLITINKMVVQTSLCLGVVLLLFFLIGHLPNRLSNSPTIPAMWTDALKLVALSGGAFITAKVFYTDIANGFFKALYKLAFLGKYFFGIMLIIFGIDHFLYIDFVKTLVPSWIPGNVFWTYFAGTALAGSGVCIIINFQLKLISFLLGIMLFLWLIMLHIPRAVTMTTAADANETVSVLECLAFSGMAFMLYFYNDAKTVKNS